MIDMIFPILSIEQEVPSLLRMQQMQQAEAIREAFVQQGMPPLHHPTVLSTCRPAHRHADTPPLHEQTQAFCCMILFSASCPPSQLVLFPSLPFTGAHCGRGGLANYPQGGPETAKVISAWKLSNCGCLFFTVWALHKEAIQHIKR